jgi:hypothetical protein
MAETSFVRSQGLAPARATIILGLAAFGAVLGSILASVIGLEFLGFELTDADGLSTVALVGADGAGQGFVLVVWLLSLVMVAATVVALRGRT